MKPIDYLKRKARLLPKPVYSLLKGVYSYGLRNKAGFYCKALAGESNYNICINSDLSVSCNCSDYDGTGHIGNLKQQSIQEIFDGETAHRFRSLLASGTLPIPQCKFCPELSVLPRASAKEKVTQYTLPTKGIMVENTVGCNLKCLACDRKVVDTRTKRIMSLSDMEIVAKTVRDHAIQQVCYHNLGEPFLSKRIFEELKILREYNSDTTLYSSTNGVYLDTDIKKQAALFLDHIFFSIDGSSQASVEKYQVGANFAVSYKNMADMVEYRDSLKHSNPIVEWKYVVFEWNDSEEEIKAAIELARKANVDIVSFWPGGMPGDAGISRRYKTDPFFQHLGSPSWKGRELILRPEVVNSSKGVS